MSRNLPALRPRGAIAELRNAPPAVRRDAPLTERRSKFPTQRQIRAALRAYRIASEVKAANLLQTQGTGLAKRIGAKSAVPVLPAPDAGGDR